MHKEQALILIGEIRTKFIKKFSGYFYAGEVDEILLNRKWLQMFNDNAHR